MDEQLFRYDGIENPLRLCVCQSPSRFASAADARDGGDENNRWGFLTVPLSEPGTTSLPGSCVETRKTEEVRVTRRVGGNVIG